jgi:hypothetical protein
MSNSISKPSLATTRLRTADIDVIKTASLDSSIDRGPAKGSQVLQNPEAAARHQDYIEPAIDMSAIEKLLTSGLLDTKSFKLTCGDYNL